MALPKERVCLTCGKKFMPGSYMCKEKAQGEFHDVESKTYYAPAAGLLLQWKTEKRYPDPQGQGGTVFVPGKSAQFVQGVYHTSDPEEQDFLDRYAGLISYEQWEVMFVPEKMRNEKRDRELQNKIKVIDNQNEELKKLRAQLGLDPETGAKL